MPLLSKCKYDEAIVDRGSPWMVTGSFYRYKLEELFVAIRHPMSPSSEGRRLRYYVHYVLFACGLRQSCWPDDEDGADAPAQ